ncbi:apyrase-like [Agrilus planipennis]|uniref:Apyrase-like n=1 Tax=Agrilus planipennis TaxID=224129 RepID=A0A1W4WDV5_AGRPL|nr:apyrase-like [Agrilus planipennis]
MKLLFTISLFCVILNVHSLPVDVKQTDSSFEISVIHLNDFHARFEEITEYSTTCKNTDAKCIGGIARVFTAVTELLRNRPNSIFINAGDNFQGTLWYNIFKWNVTQEFLNKFPTDVYTLGNHEFDNAIEGVAPFIKSLKAPVVVANIDATDEPDILGSFNKSVIIERNGIRIGIIGVLISTTPKMAETENLVFLPESASVNEEADRLVAEENIDTIIVVSHCGYDLDKQIAANASRKIGLIVGAHSHTFLFTGDNPPGPDTPAGDYPTVIEHQDGRRILIVQASAFTKYLGNITVYYNSNGDVVDWSGAPIYLDNYTKEATIETELQPWKEVVDSYGSAIVGATEIDLPQRTCYVAECLMANVIADSMAHSYQGSNDLQYPPIAIINAGGVRAGLTAGNITYADAV